MIRRQVPLPPFFPHPPAPALTLDGFVFELGEEAVMSCTWGEGPEGPRRSERFSLGRRTTEIKVGLEHQASVHPWEPGRTPYASGRACATRGAPHFGVHHRARDGREREGEDWEGAAVDTSRIVIHEEGTTKHTFAAKP